MRKELGLIDTTVDTVSTLLRTTGTTLAVVENIADSAYVMTREMYGEAYLDGVKTLVDKGMPEQEAMKFLSRD